MRFWAGFFAGVGVALVWFYRDEIKSIWSNQDNISSGQKAVSGAKDLWEGGKEIWERINK